MTSLFERVRWHFQVETHVENKDFRLNNKHTAYSRRLQQREPALRGMFETRASVADGKG